MKKRIVQSLILLVAMGGISLSCYSTNQAEKETVISVEPSIPMVMNVIDIQPTIEMASISVVKSNEFEEAQELEITVEENEEDDYVEILSQPVIFPDAYYNPETEEYNEEEFWDDMELVALVCVAESEGESEMGKRLVIDTIFNRLDSPYFPNTIHDVIYQRNPEQYSCVWNGRLNKVEYNEYIASLVIEEMNNRTNTDVIYFKTNGYFSFGNPILQEGSHFFSGR